MDKEKMNGVRKKRACDERESEATRKEEGN